MILIVKLGLLFEIGRLKFLDFVVFLVENFLKLNSSIYQGCWRIEISGQDILF